MSSSRPWNRSRNGTGQSFPTTSTVPSTSTIGRRRRAAAMASPSWVCAFSRTSNSSRAARQVSISTTGSRLFMAFSVMSRAVVRPLPIRRRQAREPHGFAEYGGGGGEVGQAGGKGPDGCVTRQHLGELETAQRLVVRFRKAEPGVEALDGVPPHAGLHVGAQPDVQVVAALERVRERAEAALQGGVGPVTCPGPPAEVVVLPGDPRAVPVDRAVALVAQPGQHRDGPAREPYRWILTEDDIPHGAGECVGDSA